MVLLDKKGFIELDDLIAHPLIPLASLLIGIFSSIMAFSKPRKWIEKRFKLPSTRQVLWRSIFLLVSMGFVLKVGYTSGQVFALAIIEAILILGLFSMLVISWKNKQDLRDDFDNLTNDHEEQNSLFMYLVGLHKVQFRYGYMNFTYTIASDGSVHTLQEMEVVPLAGTVYFRRGYLGMSPFTKGEMAISELKARNKINNRYLRIIELGRSKRKFEYAVILDPPASPSTPAEIEIESRRSGVFTSFVNNLRQEDDIYLGADTSSLSVKLLAPHNLEFTSFEVTPDIGSRKKEKLGDRSSIEWSGTNVPHGKYKYSIHAKKVSQ